jgi:TonB family protein
MANKARTPRTGAMVSGRMFVDFYKLREQPFSETPDPRYLYLTPKNREVIASLAYGIEAGRGFLVLVADPGMGKTTLLFHLLEWLRESTRTAFLFQTQCTSRELLGNLLCDLGIASAGKELTWMHEQLKEFLVREASSDRRLVVFIDEAQNLDEHVLETVRLLSDFENPSSKLIQIVLCGQSKLADRLASPGLVQLRQRVSILTRLDPLTAEEAESYVNHRLILAGSNGKQLFTPEALAMIAVRSRGVPRDINSLCFGALSLGFAMGMPQVDCALVDEAATDLELTPAAVKPVDRQTSGVRSDSHDEIHCERQGYPPPAKEVLAGDQVAGSSQESETAGSSANCPETMIRAAEPLPLSRALASVGIALIALFTLGESGILLLDYVLVKTGIVSSAAISARAEAETYGPGAYQSPSRQPGKGPGSLQRLAGFAPYALRLEPQPEVTDADSRVLPAGIAPLSPLVVRKNLPVHARQVKEPHLTSKSPLTYPAEARRSGVEGDVVIRAVIDANGKPTGLRIVSGPLLLQRAALDSIREWQYEPGYLDGKPVAMETVISVNFRRP